MRRNCNFNIHKLPPNTSTSSSSSSSSIFGSCSDANKIEIFHSDATELQVICILWVARREMEHKSKKDGIGGSASFLQIQAHGSRNLSFKKSLHKFFQKRKERMQASLPH